MTTSLVLDTCVLPQRGSLLQNPIFSALLQIAKIRGFEVLISEMTLEESISERRRTAEKALEGLRSAITQVGKVFSWEQPVYYIPDASEAVDRWRSELSLLGLIEIEGTDAVEALKREASRIAPAKETGHGYAIGSRDAAIWLGVKRLHMSSADRNTYFISSNTKDFAAGGNRIGLRQELREELGESSSRFTYYASLEAVVTALAEKVGVRDIDDASFTRVVNSGNFFTDFFEAAHQRARVVSGNDGTGVSEVNFLPSKELQAYSLDDTRLAMWEISFKFSDVLSNRGSERERKSYLGRARAWVYEDSDEISADFDSLTALDPMATETA